MSNNIPGETDIYACDNQYSHKKTDIEEGKDKVREHIVARLAPPMKIKIPWETDIDACEHPYCRGKTDIEWMSLRER